MALPASLITETAALVFRRSEREVVSTLRDMDIKMKGRKKRKKKGIKTCRDGQ
jgi:hypothetical protein